MPLREFVLDPWSGELVRLTRCALDFLGVGIRPEDEEVRGTSKSSSSEERIIDISVLGLKDGQEIDIRIHGEIIRSNEDPIFKGYFVVALDDFKGVEEHSFNFSSNRSGATDWLWQNGHPKPTKHHIDAIPTPKEI